MNLGTVGNVHYYECTAQVENSDLNISEKASGKNKKEAKTNAITKLYFQLVSKQLIPDIYISQGKTFFEYSQPKK